MKGIPEHSFCEQVLTFKSLAHVCKVSFKQSLLNPQSSRKNSYPYLLDWETELQAYDRTGLRSSYKQVGSWFLETTKKDFFFKGFLGLFHRTQNILENPARTRSASRGGMPEDVNIRAPRAPLIPPSQRDQCQHPHTAGETEALGWDDLLTVTCANSRRAGKATASRIAGSSRQLGEQGTTRRFPVLPCDQPTLGCWWKRCSEDAPPACGSCPPPGKCTLKILLNDFLALYNEQDSKTQLHLNHPQNAARAGAEPCLAEQRGRA